MFYYYQDHLNFFLFLCQKYILHPLKNSSNIHESQELSGPLPKKLKSVKILKTCTHAIWKIWLIFKRYFKKYIEIVG